MPSVLKIIKEVSEPEPDYPPEFGQLDNLHLDLLENKAKLKPNLPLQPPKKIVKIPTPKKVESVQGTPATSPKKDTGMSPLKTSPDAKQTTRPPTVKSTSKNISPQKVSPVASDDEDMKHLYESDAEPSDVEPDIHSEDDVPQDDAVSEPDADEQAEDDGLTPEERDEQHKQEYLVKFRILKRGNPDFKEFPQYTEHTSLSALKKMYDETFKLIQLEQNVDSYKGYLRMAFVLFEMGMKKMNITSFDGFAQVQLQKIDKYDKMLIELGERSYSNFTANWPVEVRLVGVFFFDACMFFIGKMLMDNAAGDMQGFMSMMFGIQPQQRKPRMRGPSITPDQIRNNMSH